MPAHLHKECRTEDAHRSEDSEGECLIMSFSGRHIQIHTKQDSLRAGISTHRVHRRARSPRRKLSCNCDAHIAGGTVDGRKYCSRELPNIRVRTGVGSKGYVHRDEKHERFA